MIQDYTVQIILAILALTGSVIVARMASRASNRAAEVQAESQAFMRAQDIYEGGMRELRQQLADLRADVKTLRAALVASEARVLQLEAILRAHNIDVPVWSPLTGFSPGLGLME